jgi:hypothetical protein
MAVALIASIFEDVPQAFQSFTFHPSGQISEQCAIIDAVIALMIGSLTPFPSRAVGDFRPLWPCKCGLFKNKLCIQFDCL